MEYILNNEKGIPDLRTFKAVRKAFNHHAIFPAIKKMSVKAAAERRELHLIDDELPVQDLTFLSFFPNLAALSVTSKQIRDISPLLALSSLRSLYIDGAEIGTLMPIARLQGLRELTLKNMYIIKGDFEVLQTIFGPEKLHIINCDLKKLDWIKGMHSLQEAEFTQSLLADYSPIRTAPALERVTLDDGTYGKPFDLLPMFRVRGKIHG